MKRKVFLWRIPIQITLQTLSFCVSLWSISFAERTALCPGNYCRPLRTRLRTPLNVVYSSCNCAITWLLSSGFELLKQPLENLAAVQPQLKRYICTSFIRLKALCSDTQALLELLWEMRLLVMLHIRGAAAGLHGDLEDNRAVPQPDVPWHLHAFLKSEKKLKTVIWDQSHGVQASPIPLKECDSVSGRNDFGWGEARLGSNGWPVCDRSSGVILSLNKSCLPWRWRAFSGWWAMTDLCLGLNKTEQYDWDDDPTTVRWEGNSNTPFKPLDLDRFETQFSDI